ncbi:MULTISPECIES: phosphate signaling complex PhoU family protein [unclassified Flavobacterium]|jgi:phosphate transport system protein|uniref:phosphate signaling complex PhoU family protein n=1 Tax=unclassified Flavobacterium TaxID=196869 RepID=UPI0025BB8142|nr:MULTISPECIES: phosphate uptake regulator PhoU [unclassified Flavobacterium]
MSATKDKAIEKILSEFDKASKLTLKQMELLQKVIASKDKGIPSETLQQLRKNEKKLDAFELKISDRIINAMVLYGPVASELRHLMACYRMIISLERIGDLVIKTMNSVLKLNDSRLLLLNLEDINKMSDLAFEMVSKATLSFINNEKEAAIWVIQNDIVVDKLNRHIARNSILAEESHKILVDYSETRNIISSIERMADHAIHIAEASIFASVGKDVRHKVDLLT